MGAGDVHTNGFPASQQRSCAGEDTGGITVAAAAAGNEGTPNVNSSATETITIKYAYASMQRQLLLPTRMPAGGLHRHKTAPAEHCAVQIVNGICRLDKQNLLRTMRVNQIGQQMPNCVNVLKRRACMREITVPWREDGQD